MNRIILKTIIVPLVLFTFTNAQTHETIPTNHWIYKSIERLQVYGLFRSLDQGCQPYTRFQVAKVLLSDLEKNQVINKFVEIEIDRIKTELLPEIEYLQQEDVNRLKSPMKVGFTLSNFSKYKENTKNYIFFRLNGALSFYENFTLRYSAYLDQRFKDDPYFIGYDWKGFQGYQEQMYISYATDFVDLKFGRDYIKWGYGHTGNLLISDNSCPFDQFSLKVRSRYISFQAFVAQLDKMYNANRYLNAARFEIKPVANLSVGLGQSSLYGGENQSLDFTMSNPLAFYSFTQDNDRKSMNMMLYADFAWYFRNKYKLYSEFLVDDFQIDHEVKSDLEPNELAFLFGIQAVDLFFDTRGWLEFVQVRNRTYNVPDARPFEKFLHKNMPIAHPLGTDFQLFQIHLDRWMNSHFRLDLDYSLLRQGEGTIRGEFTEPWMADEVTMGTGYKEKIPYGIIETTNKIYASLHYEYNVHLQSDLSIGYETIDNLEHLEGNKSDNLFLNLNLYLAFDCLKIF
jgi:hypothetical protein